MRNKMEIPSEIGRLRQVLVYDGFEPLSVIDPAERLELLIEDTLDEDLVAQEHALFARCLRRITGPDGVLDLRALLVETATTDEGRAHIATLISGHQLPSSLAAEDLVRVLLTGFLGENRVTAPIPNIMFTRAVGAVV